MAWPNRRGGFWPPRRRQTTFRRPHPAAGSDFKQAFFQLIAEAAFSAPEYGGNLCSVPRSFRELFPFGFRVNREGVTGF